MPGQSQSKMKKKDDEKKKIHNWDCERKILDREENTIFCGKKTAFNKFIKNLQQKHIDSYKGVKKEWAQHHVITQTPENWLRFNGFKLRFADTDGMYW